MTGVAESMEQERSVRNIDKSLLDIFWNLVETAQEVRINAAFSIIRLLLGKQEAFTKNGNENVNTLCPELKYSVERLIKGMSSSRKAARQGYALALTEILKLFPAVSIKEVLKLMDTFLPLSNKQEKCQMVIGQLLTYSAIIRSGRLKEDLKSLPKVVLQLYLLSFGKSYIQETTYKLMLHLFSEISEKMFGSVWEQTKKKLSHGWETCTPDLLWFLLLCQRIFPNIVSTKFLQINWGCKNILSSENFEYLQKIVKMSTSTYPQFPPVCSEIINFLVEKKKAKKIWSGIFDEALFKSEQNDKMFLGFKVIKTALLSMPSSEKLVSAIISADFSAALTRSLMTNKHPMNAAALELVDFLGKYVKESTDAHVQITILKAFIQPPGTVLLEQMLNKKEVAAIITNLSSEAVKLLYEFLQSVILKASSNDEDRELLVRKQRQAFSQIGTLVSHTAVLADAEWRLQVIKFLFLHSFFEIKEAIEDLDPSWIPYCGSEIVSLHSSVRPAGVHSFNRALDSVNRKTGDSSFEHQVGLLKSLANFVEVLLQSSDKVAPLQPLEKVQKSWSSVRETVKKLAKQSKKDGKDIETAAFQIFFLQLGFQLFTDADHIPGILEELQVCCRKALKSRKVSNTEDSSADPPWVQVMVDLMLSLISQESHHMRCVVNSVFSLINPFITKEALQQILDVINPEEGAIEDILAENSEDENEDDVEFESGSSTDDDDEDEEKQEGKKQKSGEDEVNKLKMKVQEALGTAADLSGAESEEMMTDSEMTQLDEALSAAFRSQKKVGHLQFSTEQETLMHFRIRCLDLITIFLKTDPPMSLVLQCILSVLSAYFYGLNKRHQKNFSQKAQTTLQVLVKTKKFRDCSEVENDDIRKILRILIDKANKETNAPVAKLLSSLCVYMVTCERKLELSQHAGKKAKTAVEPSCMDQFSAALDVFINRNSSHLTPHMFVALMNACPETAWSFMKPLQDCAFDKNARLFKKSQCLGLLISSLKFSKSQKSVTKEMWLQSFETLVPKAVEALLNMLGEKVIKPTYTNELIEVLMTIIQINKEKCSETFVFTNKSEIIEALNDAKKKQLQRQGRKSVNKIVQLLGGEVSIQKPAQRKRKVSKGKENGVDENGKKSKLSNDDDDVMDGSKSTKNHDSSEDQDWNDR